MKGKQVAVAVLAAGLASLGLYGWWTGTADRRLLWSIGCGLAVAVIYVARGGSLPGFVHRYGGVHSNDDPTNIAPRIYLPLLLLAIVIAVIVLWLGLHR
jgi:hypothetical protein